MRTHNVFTAAALLLAAGLVPAVAAPTMQDLHGQGLSLLQKPGAVAEAVALWTQSCAGNYAPACLTLGEFYAGDLTDDAPDEARAREFNDRACKLGENEGCVRVGQDLLERDPPQRAAAQEIFTRACAQDQAEGCYECALLEGASAQMSALSEQGFSYLEKACRLDYGDACHLLGRAREMGLGTRADAAAAYDDYAQACLFGVEEACAEAERLQPGAHAQ